MTPHITYNAGKFYYDGNEIINPEVLQHDIHVVAVSTKGTLGRFDEKIGFVTFKDGDTFPIPATLRAEVEYQYHSSVYYYGSGAKWEHCTKDQFDSIASLPGSLTRKVVRLVEVESKPAIPANFMCGIPPMKKAPRCEDLPEQPRQSPQPEKQAIDERVRALQSAFQDGWNARHFQRNGIPSGDDALESWSLKLDLTSSQPPPQAESQLPTEKIDELIRVQIGPFYRSLAAASIQHFLDTGQINGSFLQSLRTLCEVAIKYKNDPHYPL